MFTKHESNFPGIFIIGQHLSVRIMELYYNYHLLPRAADLQERQMNLGYFRGMRINGLLAVISGLLQTTLSNIWIKLWIIQ